MASAHASIVVTAFVAGSSTSMFLAPSQSDLIRTGIVDAHLRSRPGVRSGEALSVAGEDVR
jgi:hypothetical protein